ncbi:MAG: hypothetical protein AAGE43_10800 [Pseudomonadota bacterium]
MNIEVLAAWGEFLGGISGLIAAVAVVGSLMFVGVQLRASVKQSRVDSYTQITELWTNFTNSTAADKETWDIWYRGTHDYAALAANEKARFGFLISMYFGIVDCIMVHEELGVWVSPETFERVTGQAYAVFRMPGVQAWWEENQGRVFAPRVEQYLLGRKGGA